MLKNQKPFPLLLGGTILLLGIPLVALMLNWEWAPIEAPSYFLYFLYWLTETGSTPQVFLTCIVLAAIPLLYLKPTLKKGALLIGMMIACILAGQVVKATLKNLYEEPRPYVVWLEKESYINAKDFYALPRVERAEFILAQNFEPHHIPSWHQNHWSKETGYSFPSGHSIFVAQWLMMYLLLLWRKKAYLPIALVALWAIGIEASRLLLGMHYPADLLVSNLLAPLIIHPAYLVIKKWGLSCKQGVPLDNESYLR